MLTGAVTAKSKVCETANRWPEHCNAFKKKPPRNSPKIYEAKRTQKEDVRKQHVASYLTDKFEQHRDEIAKFELLAYLWLLFFFFYVFRKCREKVQKNKYNK